MENITKYEFIKKVLCVFLEFFNMINLWFFYKQTRHLGIISITRLWSFVDLVIIIINFVIGFGMLNFDYRQTTFWTVQEFITIEKIRVIEMVGILFMWFKSLYYLQLIPRVAPLIDIVFVLLREMKYFCFIYGIA